MKTLPNENDLIQYWAYQKALNYGFYPTIADEWAPVAVEALELVVNGEWEDHPANQPFGCDYSADRIVESLYLDVFIDDEVEDYWGE